MDDYKVNLEVFSGPLDLLLYLVKKAEVDVYSVPIETVTDQYLRYLEMMQALDLSIAGDFLVMATTLMMIKSRMLLPPEEREAPAAGDEDDIDPREALVRQLIEYKKCKEVAILLDERQLQREDVFVRDLQHDKVDREYIIREVSVFDLIAAYNEALQNIKTEKLHQIMAERHTVADKIKAIEEVLGVHRQVVFSRLYQLGKSTRHEIACSFLAMLELARQRRITVQQHDRFGEILLVLAEGEGIFGN